MKTKICTKCEVEKPFNKDFFYPYKDSFEGRCRDCKKAQSKAHKPKDPMLRAAQKKLWAEQNPESNRKSCKVWYALNKEAKAVQVKKYRQDNPEIMRPARNKAHKAWKARNPEQARAIAAAKEANRKSRTPPGVDKAAIKAIYLDAKIRNFTVDHIIPLLGKTPETSGWHEPSNMQLMTREENEEKSNTQPWDREAYWLRRADYLEGIRQQRIAAYKIFADDFVAFILPRVG